MKRIVNDRAPDVPPDTTTTHFAITAYRAMLDRIDDPALPARDILLTPRLVVRTLSACLGKVP